MLTSRREDQQSFGLRRDWFVGQCREQDMADRFRRSSATRFSGLEYAASCASQRLREVVNLGTFPATFDPFQGNEESASLLLFSLHRSGPIGSAENGRDGIPSY